MDVQNYYRAYVLDSCNIYEEKELTLYVGNSYFRARLALVEYKETNEYYNPKYYTRLIEIWRDAKIEKTYELLPDDYEVKGYIK